MKLTQTFKIFVLAILSLGGSAQAETVKATLVAKVFKSPEQNIAYVTDISVSLDRDLGFGTSFPLINQDAAWLVCKNLGLSTKDATYIKERIEIGWAAYFYPPGEPNTFGFGQIADQDTWRRYIVKMVTCRIQ